MRFRPGEQSSYQDLVKAQYAGKKAGLFAIYELLVAAVQRFGYDVTLAPRKTYVGLVHNKVFGVIKPSTTTCIDLGLKLKYKEGKDRLVEAPGFGSGLITHKVALARVEDVDDELIAWMRQAYEE